MQNLDCLRCALRHFRFSQHGGLIGMDDDGAHSLGNNTGYTRQLRVRDHMSVADMKLCPGDAGHMSGIGGSKGIKLQ